MTRSIAWTLIAWLLVLASPFPALALEPPSLLGVRAQAGAAAPLGMLPEEMPVAPVAPVAKAQGPWLARFGRGFLNGLANAVPNILRALRDHPLRTLGVAVAMIAAGIYLPPVAALAFANVLLAVAVARTGGQPEKLGELLGEMAFWGGAGFLAPRAWKSLSGTKEAPYWAPPNSPWRPVKPGQKFDTVTGMKLHPEQIYHGQLWHGRGTPIHSRSEFALAYQRHLDYLRANKLPVQDLLRQRAASTLGPAAAAYWLSVDKLEAIQHLGDGGTFETEEPGRTR